MALDKSIDVERAFYDPVKLEGIVREEVEITAALFKSVGLKYIIIGSDQSPYARILCAAAKLANAKSAVIGHGYFGIRHLGGVLPVYADRLFVWTPLQENDIHDVMKSAEKEKVVYRGFPYPVNRAKPKGKVVLIVLSDVSKFSPDTWWAIYEALVINLAKAGWKIIVRPRRPETEDDYGNYQRSQLMSSLVVRRDDLYDQFDEVGAVVGGASSAVVQAKYYGLDSVRVMEWSSVRQRGEGIDQCPVGNIADRLNRQVGVASLLTREVYELTLGSIISELDSA